MSSVADDEAAEVALAIAEKILLNEWHRQDPEAYSAWLDQKWQEQLEGGDTT